MASTIGTAYVQIEPSFEGVVPKIDKEFGGVGKESGNSFASGFGSVMGTVGKVAAGAAAAGTAAVAGMVKSAVASFADYEQLVGGVETLFGNAASAVMANADRAFESAGLSANQYMETVTSFSASLLQSVGGDTEKAATIADQAIVDMSDNANKMGSTMESIQNAYQGFAKQNYTMLDNLKLGYGGTKEEMKRLLEDAQKLSGQKFDLSSYADIIEAIHVIQTEMGITGTTAEEASSTISGAFNMTKASWQNLLTAMGTGDDNAISKAIDNLVSSATKLGENVMPVVVKALQGISQLITQLAPKIAEAIPGLITEILPGLLDAGVQVVQSLGQGILSAIPSLMPTITSLIMQLCELLVTMLPQILEIGVQVIQSLAKGIVEAIPTLLPVLTNVIIELIGILTDPNNINTVISAGIDIILALADGIVQALPQLIAAIPQVIESIIVALTNPDTITKIIQAAIYLIQSTVENLPTIIQALVDAIPNIVQALTTALTDPECVTAIIMGCVQLVAAIVQAIPEITAELINAIPDIIVAIVMAFMALGPALQQCFSDVLASLSPSFIEFGSNLLEKAGEIFNNLISSIETWLSQLPERMAYYAGYAIGAFINFFIQLPDKIQAIWASITSNTTNFATQFAQKAAEMAKNFSKSLIDGLQSLPSKLVELGQQLIEAIKNLPKKFAEIGSNIVNGLWDGISSGWKKLTEKVQGLADDLLDGVKDGLKINSPSKVFADEVGQWIPAGIAEGINKGADNLKKAAKALTGEVLQTNVRGTMEMINSTKYTSPSFEQQERGVVITNNIKVDGAQDPEAWTQSFIRTLKREARMA